MTKFNFFFALVFVSLTLISCDSNENSSPTQNDDTFAENFGSEVSKDFIGQVVDTDNNPIHNATIKIGTSTVQTDVNGVFMINGATVHEKFAYIKATKAGYIDGSRAMVPTSGKNNVKIMLIPNTPLETIQSGVASEVSIYSGTKVNFDGAFQDENGNTYNGTVSVSMFHLTPSDENIDKLMPGMLYAQTATNQEAVLETFGMLNVELRGSAGQKLNISEGHTAEITMRIDDTQLATAPNSIPLWHFDEEKGYWKEDGVATKVGNKYVGEVSHFSWWNCDIPNSSILLTFNFVDDGGNPLSNVNISILNQAGYHASGSTDSNGQLAGILPANQVFTINVYSSFYLCGTSNALYTGTCGPFTSDTVLPNIVINTATPTLNSTNVVGTLVKCDNTNVTNGYVLLSKGGSSVISPVTNGSFSFNELYCPGNTQFTLNGVDYDNMQQTGLIQYNFKMPNTYVGNLMTCNSITEFVSFQVDNGPVVFYITNLYTSFEVVYPTMTPYGISFRDNNTSGSSSFSIWTSFQLPGFYHDPAFTTESGPSGYINSAINAISFDFNVAKAGPVGEYIDMTFDGTYYDGNNVVHRLRGTVHVIRRN